MNENQIDWQAKVLSQLDEILAEIKAINDTLKENVK